VESTGKRPDLIDLIGPQFDHESDAPARRTIIICSAPRTGSYELCRFMTAAGVGVPHEYFNPNYARRLATRWALQEDPLSETMIPSYVEMLRRRRAANDIFSIKLQYWQFEEFLRSRHGATLFEEASIVHLFRPDVAAQFASYRLAVATGQWDYSERQTLAPSPSGVDAALGHLDMLVAADAGFRRLFVLLGIRPLFVTTEQLFADPRAVVMAIAETVDATVNAKALDEAIAASAPYGRADAVRENMAGISDALRQRAFLR
jgi:LPS sulfotransferase NodH